MLRAKVMSSTMILLSIITSFFMTAQAGQRKAPKLTPQEQAESASDRGWVSVKYGSYGSVAGAIIGVSNMTNIGSNPQCKTTDMKGRIVGLDVENGYLVGFSVESPVLRHRTYIAIDDYVRGSLNESDSRDVVSRVLQSDQLMHIVAYGCGAEARLTAFTVELLHVPGRWKSYRVN